MIRVISFRNEQFGIVIRITRLRRHDNVQRLRRLHPVPSDHRHTGAELFYKLYAIIVVIIIMTIQREATISSVCPSVTLVICGHRGLGYFESNSTNKKSIRL